MNEWTSEKPPISGLYFARKDGRVIPLHFELLNWDCVPQEIVTFVQGELFRLSDPNFVGCEFLQIPEAEKLIALFRLGAVAARAGFLRKKEQDNESYEMSGPLEYDAEGAEADLIRAAQEYFEQFPEVIR